MMSEQLITVDNISKRFCRNFRRSLWYAIRDMASELLGRQKCLRLRKYEFLALDGINFQLESGKCIGIIGPNGAGKSTLLKVITGILKPEQGEVIIRGRVSALIQLMAGFNTLLTGRENIYVKAAILGMNKTETDLKMDEIVRFAELEDFIDSPVQTYSSGMLARLGFSIAIHTDPDVLIIDEVLAVGDAGFRNKCFKKINEIRQTSAVIFISHNIHSVSRICDKIMILDQGKVLGFYDEVSEGIEKYLELFATLEPRIEKVDSVEVVGLCVNGHPLFPVQTVTFREPLVVSFDLVSRAGNPLEIRLFFQSLNLEHLSMTCSRTDQFQLLANGGKKRRVSMQLNELSLGVEKAYLTLEVCDSITGERLYQNYAMTLLTVKGQPEVYFSPQVNHATWDVCDA
jgi:lipopolysaccharide transport system ATP-binding protein